MVLTVLMYQRNFWQSSDETKNKCGLVAMSPANITVSLDSLMR